MSRIENGRWRYLGCSTHRGSIGIDFPSGKTHAVLSIRERGRGMIATRLPSDTAQQIAALVESHPNAGWDPA